jgi:hypothetical protein
MNISLTISGVQYCFKKAFSGSKRLSSLLQEPVEENDAAVEQGDEGDEDGVRSGDQEALAGEKGMQFPPVAVYEKSACQKRQDFEYPEQDCRDGR